MSPANAAVLTSLYCFQINCYANITFDNVEIPEANILGDLETGGETVENILDIGRIAMASEMLGNSEAAFEITLDYLKQRKQFGVLIGSFQALQ